MNRLLHAIAVVALLALATGCGSTAKHEPGHVDNGDTMGSAATGSTDSTDPAASGSEGAGTGARAGAADGDRVPAAEGSDWADGGAGGRRGSSSGANAQEGHPVPELETVFFRFDEDVLTDDAKATLARNAAHLGSHASLHVILRGHCDDRGTEEYNVSLGQRRAEAVLEFLKSKGLPGDRFETVSFGKSIPLSDGTDEAARSRNRRVEFFVYE